MKPNKAGIWEWFTEKGEKKYVLVCNVGVPGTTYFRVYFGGSYYNVNDETDPEHPEYAEFTKAEWPERWGNYVGPSDSMPDEELYISRV